MDSSAIERGNHRRSLSERLRGPKRRRQRESQAMISLLLFSLEDNCKPRYKKWNLWTCDHPRVCECSTTLNNKRQEVLSREPHQTKESDRNVGNWSPLLTGCRAGAEAVAADAAAMAVAVDAVTAETTGTEAMDPQAPRACAAHSERTSSTMG